MIERLQECVTGKLCWWCGTILFDPIKLKTRPELWRLSSLRCHISTRDHFIPKCKNGWGFTVACCRYCNTLKGSMSPMQFRDQHRQHISREAVERMVTEAKYTQAAIRIHAPHKKPPKERDRISESGTLEADKDAIRVHRTPQEENHHAATSPEANDPRTGQ